MFTLRRNCRYVWQNITNNLSMTNVLKFHSLGLIVANFKMPVLYLHQGRLYLHLSSGRNPQKQYNRHIFYIQTHIPCIPYHVLFLCTITEQNLWYHQIFLVYGYHTYFVIKPREVSIIHDFYGNRHHLFSYKQAYHNKTQKNTLFSTVIFVKFKFRIGFCRNFQ